MLRYVRASLGLAGLVVGLSLGASSTSVLMAEPVFVAGCPCTDESQASKSCQSGLDQCADLKTAGACTGPNRAQAYKVNSFPSECLNNQKDRLCSTNDDDCYFFATCSWDATMSPPCQLSSAGPTAAKRLPKPVGGDCNPKGGPCPVIVPAGT
jgi:hypothetical protein